MCFGIPGSKKFKQEFRGVEFDVSQLDTSSFEINPTLVSKMTGISRVFSAVTISFPIPFHPKIYQDGIPAPNT